jgi:predicted membrane channel-forming protein YqfA (hemolysin III family)
MIEIEYEFYAYHNNQADPDLLSGVWFVVGIIFYNTPKNKTPASKAGVLFFQGDEK